jgi:alpha-ketoglutarate-dependent taurine dioxygenase
MLCAGLLHEFYDHSVIVLRDQQVDFATFDRFCRYFGSPKPHFLDHLRLPGYDSILLLLNVRQNSKAIEVYEGAAFSHTHVAYEDLSNSGTIVYALEVPEDGGRTWFENQSAAYAALPRIDEGPGATT